MKDHPLYPLSLKLRPELKTLDGPAGLQAFSEVLVVLCLTPFVVVGMIWLVAASMQLSLSGNIPLLALLAGGILVMNSQTAAIYVEVSTKEKLALTSSFGSVIYWAGFLLWGPTMIWAGLFADLITGFTGALKLRRLNQNAFWGSAANILQSMAPIPGVLFALWIYNALGGSIPITGTNFVEWIPALAAIVVSSIFPSLVMLPIFYNITTLTGVKNTAANIRFVISAVAFNLIPAPFGIPIALLFVKVGVWPYVAMILGVVLVNFLAHHLSRTNQRNMQQAKEMSQLEQLGEEILQSPPDGSKLAEIVHKRVKSMFSNQLDILALHLFDNAALTGYAASHAALNLVHPNESFSPDASIWDDLRNSEKDYLVLKDQTPKGFNLVYGDAVLVKVISAEPVSDGEEPVCIGGIYLLMNKTVARTVDSLSAVQALASQIASAIYRAQVYKETLAAQKMSQELEFAWQIQSSFLPEAVPQLDGWSIAATLIPARQTSGDFYDFIPLPNGKLGIIVADVADKGTGAALYMALSRTLLRTFAFQYPDTPAGAFRMANDRIFEDSRADQFVTVFYGVLEPDTGRFEYCNAGHNPTFLLRAGNGHEPEALKRTGVALGAMEGLTWKSASIDLNKDDILLFYMDGVVEAQDENEQFFGEERLTQSAKDNETASAETIQTGIMEKLHSFVGGADQFDDITLLTLKRE